MYHNARTILAEATGFEPAISALTGQRFKPLSYASATLCDNTALPKARQAPQQPPLASSKMSPDIPWFPQMRMVLMRGSGMTTEDTMTITERRNYLTKTQSRYRGATAQEQSRLVTEMEAITGMHCKGGVLRTGNGPQVTASLNGLARGLIARGGHTNVAQAGRIYAAFPDHALALRTAAWLCNSPAKDAEGNNSMHLFSSPRPLCSLRPSRFSLPTPKGSASSRQRRFQRRWRGRARQNRT